MKREPKSLHNQSVSLLVAAVLNVFYLTGSELIVITFVSHKVNCLTSVHLECLYCFYLEKNGSGYLFKIPE